MYRTKKPVIDITGSTLHFSDGVGSLNYYLKDVRKYELLDEVSERKLFERIKNGDTKAVEELVNANQRFVLGVAKRYSSGDNIMDLVQVGNIGMLAAISKYDVNMKGPDGKPVRFLSYAAWFIRREISSYVTNDQIIKKTNNIKTIFKINKVKNTFYLKNGRFPSVEEISDIIREEYGYEVKDKSYLYDVETKYLNSSLSEDNNKDTFEQSQTYNEKSAVQNEVVEQIDEDYNKYYVGRLLGFLSDRERSIIEKIYGINQDKEYTMDEIATELGLTRERVRQLKTSAENKMKKIALSKVGK